MRWIFIVALLLLSGCSNTPSEPLTIVAFGDSLTEGFGLSADDAYPAQLERFLHQKGYGHITVINEGVSGDTSSNLLARADDVLKHNPDLVILTIGANDIKRGGQVDNLKGNLEELITLFQSKGITVVLGGMQPLGKLGAFIEGPATSTYSDLSDQYDVRLIPFFLRGVAGNSQYNIADGVHPNKAGYAKIVEENVWPVLKKELK